MSIPTFSEYPEIPQRSTPEAEFDAKMYALFQHLAITNRNELLAFIAFLETNSTVIGAALNATTIGLNTPAAGKFTALEAASLGVGGTVQANGVNFGQDTLGQYDEGTWTPVLSDGTNTATAASNGTYVRIGDMVHVQGRIPVSSLGSVAGKLRIAGLPFVSTNSSAAQGGGQVSSASGLSMGTAAQIILFPQQGFAFLHLFRQGTGGTASLTAGDFTDAADIKFSATYKTE